MSKAQAARLKQFCTMYGGEFDPTLSRAEAGERIAALKQQARKPKGRNVGGCSHCQPKGGEHAPGCALAIYWGLA